MSGWERSAAGSSRPNLPASVSSLGGGYATPSARSHGGANDGGRRSFLPRPSVAGEESMRKKAAASSSAGPVSLRRRSSVDDMAFKARRSAVGRGGSTLLSMKGVASGGGGTGAPSSAMVKATPVCNVLNVVNYNAPLSTQSKRMSSQSRQSNAGRHKRRDVRPINDAAFKKRCIDNIFNFLVENNYGNQDSSLLNRRVLTSPTNKDFANIFTFIYGMLTPNYKLPSRFDEEIPSKLKLLGYPSQIPKSTFASVGSPHSWPLLLAMLSWLCDLVTTVVTTTVQEMAYPADFENAVNPIWQNLCLCLEATSHPEPEHQHQYLLSHKEMLEQEMGVSDQQRQQLEEKVAHLAYEEQQLKQDESILPQLRHSNAQLTSDCEKLKKFNSSLKLKTEQLELEIKREEHELCSKQRRKDEMKAEIERLSALKASQNFSPEELLRIKNHEQTTAAYRQQLQDQAKQVQEKMWSAEMRLCKAQVLRSELIQQYNSSPVASRTGTLATVHQPSQNLMDTSDSDEPAPVGVTAPLQEKDIQELSQKLAEELRLTRAKVVEAHTNRSKIEEQCRSMELQVEEKKLQVAQLKRKISSIEEDMSCSKHEWKIQESAMLEELKTLQDAVSAARRAPKPQLFTRQQRLLTLRHELETKKMQLKRRCEEGCSSVQRMCAEIDNLLQFEDHLAQELRDDLKSSLASAGDPDR